MTINNDAYTKAIHHVQFSPSEKQPGGHAWAMRLIENYEAHRTGEVHVFNLIKQARGWLLDNKPVQAMDTLRNLEKYLYEQQAKGSDQ